MILTETTYNEFQEELRWYCRVVVNTFFKQLIRERVLDKFIEGCRTYNKNSCYKKNDKRRFFEQYVDTYVSVMNRDMFHFSKRGNLYYMRWYYGTSPNNVMLHVANSDISFVWVTSDYGDNILDTFMRCSNGIEMSLSSRPFYRNGEVVNAEFYFANVLHELHKKCI